MNTQDRLHNSLRDLRQCVNFISRQSSATANRMSAAGAKAISDIEAELSRLRAEREELLGALEKMIARWKISNDLHYRRVGLPTPKEPEPAFIVEARAAIQKAQKS